MREIIIRNRKNFYIQDYDYMIYIRDMRLSPDALSYEEWLNKKNDEDLLEHYVMLNKIGFVS